MRSYYSEKNCQWLIDRLKLLTKEGMIKLIPNKEGLSLNSLYQKLVTSWKYLIEHHDEDQFFYNLRDIVVISRDKTQNVIYLRVKTQITASMATDMIKRQRDLWKPRFDNFISTGKTEDGDYILEVTGLTLTRRDISYILQFASSTMKIEVTPTNLQVVNFDSFEPSSESEDLQETSADDIKTPYSNDSHKN